MTVMRFSVFVLITILGLVILHHSVEAAVLSIDPAQIQTTPGETFVVDVRLNSENEYINAVATQISYSPDLLEVMDLSRGGSFLTLWPEEPTDNEQTGIISLIGGIPNGSYVVDGRVLTITFRAKALGEAAVRFVGGESSVHLNDGQGTKAPLRFVAGSFEVRNSSPFSISIRSSTHPDENVWSQQRNITLTWETHPASLYSYDLSHNPLVEPDDTPEENADEAVFQDVTDGIYYFAIKEKLPGDTWGPTTRRRIMIDRTTPQDFQPIVTKEDSVFGGKFILLFASHDLASGIARYDVQEGEAVRENVTSPYVLKNQSRKNIIRVIAIDKAGNTKASTIPADPQKTSYAIYVILIFLLTVILFMAFRIRKKTRKIF